MIKIRMNTRRMMIIGAIIAIFTLFSAIGSVNAGVSFSYNLTGNGDIKAYDDYKDKAISYGASSIKEVQYSFSGLGTNSDTSSLYRSFSTTKGLEANSIFNYVPKENSTKGGMDMTEKIGLTSVHSNSKENEIEYCSCAAGFTSDTSFLNFDSSSTVSEKMELSYTVNHADGFGDFETWFETVNVMQKQRQNEYYPVREEKVSIKFGQKNCTFSFQKKLLWSDCFE